MGNKKKRWKKPLELGLEINNNRETAGPLSKHAALRALRQAIWWLAYATSIPNPKSDIAGEGLGRGRCATCINFKTIYLIKVSCSYLIFSVCFFFFFTLPDNQFSPDGEMLLDLICDARRSSYTHNIDQIFPSMRVRMSVERACYIS